MRVRFFRLDCVLFCLGSRRSSRSRLDSRWGQQSSSVAFRPSHHRVRPVLHHVDFQGFSSCVEDVFRCFSSRFASFRFLSVTRACLRPCVRADFGAWYRVVDQLPAVGFYNSAAEAGASQRHKHMQVCVCYVDRAFGAVHTYKVRVEQHVSVEIWKRPGHRRFCREKSAQGRTKKNELLFSSLFSLTARRRNLLHFYFIFVLWQLSKKGHPGRRPLGLQAGIC